MQALDLFKNANRRVMPGDAAPLRGRMFKTQAEAWEDGWNEAMRRIANEANEFLWEVDPW